MILRCPIGRSTDFAKEVDAESRRVTDEQSDAINSEPSLQEAAAVVSAYWYGQERSQAMTMVPRDSVTNEQIAAAKDGVKKPDLNSVAPSALVAEAEKKPTGGVK